MKNPIEQDYSEASILAAYEAGVTPYTMVIHICDVCEALLQYPEF